MLIISFAMPFCFRRILFISLDALKKGVEDAEAEAGRGRQPLFSYANEDASQTQTSHRSQVHEGNLW